MKSKNFMRNYIPWIANYKGIYFIKKNRKLYFYKATSEKAIGAAFHVRSQHNNDTVVEQFPWIMPAEAAELEIRIKSYIAMMSFIHFGQIVCVCFA